MKGNYIGKKPVGYGQISSGKPGMWEIYDQGQFTRDGEWTGLPWEVNKGYYTNKKWPLGLSETTFQDVQFKPDGTKFYTVGQTNDTVYQYSCSTAWDVSTASYDSKSFSVATQDNTPNGLFFKDDGTKFYIIGNTNDAIYQYSCFTAWDISTASYDSKSFSIATEDTTPQGLFFKPDGTKFYIIGNANDTVYQYSCSTAWDVSTASYDSKSFSVATQETGPTAVFFKDDGTKFYIVGNINDTVYQYSCSTAWDVSTGSYDSKLCRVLFEGTPTGLCFKSDGTKLYVIGTTNNRVYELTLSTAWDVSTNNTAGGGFYVGGQETNASDVSFKNNGTKFYIVGTTNDTVYQYSCSTAWDVSTGSYDSKSFSVGTQENSPQGLFFKDDGTKFYIVGVQNDAVYQYSCSTAWDISTASYDSKSFSVATQENESRSVFFKDDGTKFYIVGATNDTVYQYSCSTAWDVSTASYDSKSFSVGTQDATPNGLFFKSDGTKFYITGTTNDTVYQYSCSTAWDISTASYDSKSFSVATQETTPTGFFFKSDGTRLYVVGQVNDTVWQYDVPLAWDIVNAGFTAKNMNAALQEATPQDITFKPDGTRFYVIGSTNDAIFQYDCSNPWDVTTAFFNKTASGAFGRARVNFQDGAPLGVVFKDDGTKFYIIGNTNDTVYQYSCATAWDVSTASYDNKSFSVATQDTTPTGLFFKNDGTKFYIIGNTNDNVYQYSCSTAWDVSTASYDSKSFSIVTQENESRGVFFKDDGTKFYIVGQTNDTVYQYSCSTAWDVSTASYDSKSLSVLLQTTSAAGVCIGYYGTTLYITDNVASAAIVPSVYQYYLT
jgi:sugar lactone lactonase YvrE